MSCTISLKNVCAKIGERTLFENLNLNATHKDKIALIGPNGCGKSTLLEIMAGLKAPCGGHIELFHHKISNLDEYKPFRRDMGYLFQESNDCFICPSVLDDVMFSLFSRGEDEDGSRAKAEKILRELEIWHLKDEIVFNLSGGEKKLVALAGILVAEPKILLLDEPTTALDADMQRRIAAILKSLDVTQIIVSHDKEFISDVASVMYCLTKNGLEPI
ncbi:ABC transporter ATP-binding protein [uncultured Campylobacter sp.]|uniref:energy-coupling factor ABC transporter ATP-binding protein n=1 Tax=uncultured Campylobacter sp. TaxID=218934 RepID=UPI002630432E|nr:ABC transporter ATP-binding protein [uncultured Campylobacter sp.]